jgi:hypothetical protein
MSNWMRDPTSETSPVKRLRRAPPPSLNGKTIALFDIGKARTEEFLDQVEIRFIERGLKVKRFGKPTNAKVATPEIVQKVVDEADAVLIALSD